MIKIKNLLLFFYFCTFSYQQCLDEAVLKGLGFIDIKKDPEKNSDIDVCGDLFDNVGFCVDPEEIQQKLQNTKIQIKGKMNYTGEIGDLFKNLEVSLAQRENEKQKVEQIDQEFQSKQDSCFQAMQKVNMGTLCYLASGNASTNTVVNANEIKINVNGQSTGLELENCVPMYDALCLFQTGQSITTDTEIKSFQNDKTNTDFQKACKVLRQFKDCKQGQCKERFKALIEDMRPTDLDLLPQEEFLNEISKQFDTFSQNVDQFLKENFGSNDLIDIDVDTNIDDKIKDSIDDLKDKDVNDVVEDTINDQIDQFINSFRRLQGESTYKITMQSSDNGEDVVKYGEDSGVPIEENANGIIFSTLFWSFYVLYIN